jgi:hypothetical protein
LRSDQSVLDLRSFGGCSGQVFGFSILPGSALKSKIRVRCSPSERLQVADLQSLPTNNGWFKPFQPFNRYAQFKSVQERIGNSRVRMPRQCFCGALVENRWRQQIYITNLTPVDHNPVPLARILNLSVTAGCPTTAMRNHSGANQVQIDINKTTVQVRMASFRTAAMMLLFLILTKMG